MITSEKIDEWVREVEERPTSAPLIIQYIAKRMSYLANRNEELLAENIMLRTGQKMEEYESRIANLEYQLDLLKRQFGGEILAKEAEAASLIVYTNRGQVLRIELDEQTLANGQSIARFALPELEDHNIFLLVAGPQEELLFVFDSGRTETRPVSAVPAAAGEELTWADSLLVEPRSGEDLASVLPVAKMGLFEFVVQASRRGCVKKMMETSFEAHMAKNFIGTGVKEKTDRTCCLALATRDDLFVMASREGFLFSMPVAQLNFTIDEAMRLAVTDHIVTSFIPGQKPILMLVTNTGKAVQRDMSWIEPAASFKSKGQAAISPSRRDAGTRLAAALPVAEEDWGAALLGDGSVSVHQVAGLLSSGSIPLPTPDTEVLAFTSFSIQPGSE